MLLSIENLSVTFPARGKSPQVKAVEGLSLQLDKGEMLALVGESGSGKSLTALAALGLLPPGAERSGTIHLGAEAGYKDSTVELTGLSEREMCRIRGNAVSMVFQEPMTALNPLHTIGKQIGEVLKLHGKAFSKEEAQKRILELLNMVGLQKLQNRLDAYPHQLSGGERQRVMIAMAMACEPKLLIADEPTTAVDVTIQAQILALLKELQREKELAILMITHDLTIVEKLADRVAVMKAGQLVEQGNTKEVFANPQHDYTKMLLDSAPSGTAPDVPKDAKPVLSAKEMTVRFPSKKSFLGNTKEWFTAVDGISLDIAEQSTLGVVGESGSGKTTLALALLRLIKAEGKIVFLSQNIDALSIAEMRPLRNQLQVVFQDPYGSLNPRMTVERILAEGLRVHQPELTAEQQRQRCQQALEETGLSADMLDRYPHEFSGGQRQRIAIARAMVLSPRFVVLDEPTSALDRTVQKQIIELLRRLQAEHQVSFLFISHDLRVVRALCHEVIVMKAGSVVEQGSAAEIFEKPQQPYTQKLLKAAFLSE